MSRFEVNDVARLGLEEGHLVILYVCSTDFPKDPGWGVAYLNDYVRGPSTLFGTKESALHPMIWTFTGYVDKPHAAL